MKQSKELKRKIKSIVSIQHITRAMKMVSAAKFKRAQNKLNAINAYFKRIKETINDMSAYLLNYKPPFIVSSDDNTLSEIGNNTANKTKCLVVITGDKGLCGSFNANVCKEAERIAKEFKNNGYDTIFITIGIKGYEYLKKRGYNIVSHIPLLKPDPSFEEIEPIVNDILKLYENNISKDISILYTHYVSTIVYKIVLEQVLPLKLNIEKTENHNLAYDFMFEPNPHEIINYLIIRYIKMIIYNAIIESSCSEQGSRMMTMNSATDKATELIDHLTLKLNRARQESITAEILDIVGGVNALKQ